MLNVYSINTEINLYTQKKKINSIIRRYTQSHTQYPYANRTV